MPITSTERLILVEAKKIEFTSKKTGDIVKKWKYKFVQKFAPGAKPEFVVAYDDLGVYSENVETIDGWDESKAKDYVFTLTEFDGETKKKLYIAKDEADALNSRNQ